MIPTGADGTLATPGPGQPPASWALGVPRAWWWALGAAGVVLALAYAPNLLELGRTWGNDGAKSHCNSSRLFQVTCHMNLLSFLLSL